MRRTDLRREPEPFERLQPPHADGLVERAARTGAHKDVLVGLADQCPVDAGQPFLPDLGTKTLFNRIVGARAKIEIDQFARALAQTVADIVACDDQIVAAPVLAAHDDMRVRMARIIMIDRHPIERGAEILFHARHEPPG